MKARRMERRAGHHAQVVRGHNMRSTEPTLFEPSVEMAVACQKPSVLRAVQCGYERASELLRMGAELAQHSSSRDGQAWPRNPRELAGRLRRHELSFARWEWNSLLAEQDARERGRLRSAPPVRIQSVPSAASATTIMIRVQAARRQRQQGRSATTAIEPGAWPQRHHHMHGRKLILPLASPFSRCCEPGHPAVCTDNTVRVSRPEL